jgi:nucleoside-diphosphate-sugar epimerase
LVEKDLKLLADDNFSPTFLRNATAFGASPRMRFDIVLNNLAGLAWTTQKIKMTSDGKPWRPLVHALDICKAIICVLDSPKDIIHNEVFNVGDTKNNYRVKEIAEIIANTFDNCQLFLGENSIDNRSYRVSFDKINTILPGFKCEWDAQRGAKQLFELFNKIDMDEDIFLFRGFTRLKQLEYLIRTRQINNEFFWDTR